MFYSKEEFDYQMQELMYRKNMSSAAAQTIVEAQMLKVFLNYNPIDNKISADY